MHEVDDLIEPGAEQICSPVSRRSRGCIAHPSLDDFEGKESQPPIRWNPQKQFARKLRRCPPNPAKGQSLTPINGLGILHGRR
jgi:hypothetical protein